MCSVLTHFVDFYINFTLRQWKGRVERAHIIFFSRRLGGSLGEQGIGHRGAAAPATPLASPMYLAVAYAVDFIRMCTLQESNCFARRRGAGLRKE